MEKTTQDNVQAQSSTEKKSRSNDSKQASQAPRIRREAATDGVSLPMSLIKALREKSSANGDNGSSSSNGGSGNNSDNSALVSLGNTSFGFNFDSEEMMNNSPRNSNSEEGDSDGNNGSAYQNDQDGPKAKGKSQLESQHKSDPDASSKGSRGEHSSSNQSEVHVASSSTSASHHEAAAAASANLQSIASEYAKTQTGE